MDEKTREKMVSSFENAVLLAGGKDYETGMMQASKLFEFALSGLASINTKEKLRKALDSGPVISKRERQLVLVALRMLPQVLRIGFKIAAKKAALTLPPPPGGRPRATNSTQAGAVQSYILELIGKGCTPKTAKDRAARKFGLSGRTIARLWSVRGTIQEDEPRFEDVLRYISTGE